MRVTTLRRPVSGEKRKGSSDFAGNQGTGEFFWEIWHGSGILQKNDIFVMMSLKTLGESSKFPGGLKVTQCCSNNELSSPIIQSQKSELN